MATKINHLLILIAFPALLWGQRSISYVIGEVNHREMYLQVHYEHSPPIAACAVSITSGDTAFAHVRQHRGDLKLMNYRFTGLEPGTEYRVGFKPARDTDDRGVWKTYVRTPDDWEYHMPPPDISFVAGSCTYINERATDRPGTPYGGDYEILYHMFTEDVDFNLWLGDNIYLRPSDYSSAYGIHRRYRDTRSNDSLQMLLMRRPNYAIWDDHDAGPNNVLSDFTLIDSTQSAFALHWPRSQYGWKNHRDNRFVQRQSDIVLIGLDNRTYRTSEHSDNPQILGDEQIQWMESQIRTNLDAAFIFVCVGGQVLNSAAIFENHAQYPEELNRLLNAVTSTEYNNVVFLTGDRHHSEMSTVLRDGVRITDYTISPLTSGASSVRNEVNDNRVGEVIQKRNYAVLSVTGIAEERTLRITYYDAQGDEIFSREIKSM